MEDDYICKESANVSIYVSIKTNSVYVFVSFAARLFGLVLSGAQHLLLSWEWQPGSAHCAHRRRQTGNAKHPKGIVCILGNSLRVRWDGRCHFNVCVMIWSYSQQCSICKVYKWYIVVLSVWRGWGEVGRVSAGTISWTDAVTSRRLWLHPFQGTLHFTHCKCAPLSVSVVVNMQSFWSWSNTDWTPCVFDPAAAVSEHPLPGCRRKHGRPDWRLLSAGRLWELAHHPAQQRYTSPPWMYQPVIKWSVTISI